MDPARIKNGLYVFLNSIPKAIIFIYCFNLGLNVGAYISNKITSRQANTIVISNVKEDELFGSYRASFWMYSPVTLRQNVEGNRVGWYTSPTKDETLDLLTKREYENVVLIGHGTRSSYALRDGNIYAQEFLQRPIQKKKGKLIQHTCGVANLELSLSDVLLQNPSKVEYLGEKVTALDNYFHGVFKFFETVGHSL